MPAVRRLAAILAADVAGYSRLMGTDEEGTHERLKAHRRELVDPKISEHSGRIVKTTGDGMLVEFASVVDAVRCAAEVQRAMIDGEAGMPEDLVTHASIFFAAAQHSHRRAWRARPMSARCRTKWIRPSRCPRKSRGPPLCRIAVSCAPAGTVTCTGYVRRKISSIKPLHYFLEIGKLS
jgi:hypothetical protein